MNVDPLASLPNLNREVHHRFVETASGRELISAGFNVGLPELQTRKKDATQPDYSISYVLEGEGQFEDDKGRSYRFHPGSVVQRYPDCRYSIHRLESFSHSEFFIVLPRSIYDSFDRTGIIQRDYSVFDTGLDPLFANRLSSFVRDFRNSSDGELRSALMETISLIVDCFKRDRSQEADSDEARLIERACQLLSENFAAKLKLEEIAATLGISYESFRKKFRQRKNISPAQFRIQKRLEQAMALLIEDKAPIKEIAFDLGYANSANFNKLFQKATGQSPAAFRAEHRQRFESNR